ncbi:hypothetical protein B0H21DRAFT_712463 [Amylocystis lapponica]|nr:hypothetical protein B0H21DRAFT_712463 [Amylocystis lapponica]
MSAVHAGESSATGAKGPQRENPRPVRREPATTTEPTRSNLGQTQPTDNVYIDRFNQPHVLPPVQQPLNRPAAAPEPSSNDENVPPPSTAVVATTRPATHSIRPNSASKKSNEVCYKYTVGRCPYGSRCHRLHERPDAPPAGASTAPPQPQPSGSKPVELAPPAGQKPAEGAKAQAGVQPKPSEPTKSVPAAAPSKVEVCRNFLRGQCHRRPCQYYHPPPEGRAQTSSSAAPPPEERKQAPAAAPPAASKGAVAAVPAVASASAKAAGKAPEKGVKLVAPAVGKSPETATRAPASSKVPEVSSVGKAAASKGPETATRAPASSKVPEKNATTQAAPADAARETAEEDQDSYDRSLSAAFAVESSGNGTKHGKGVRTGAATVKVPIISQPTSSSAPKSSFPESSAKFSLNASTDQARYSWAPSFQTHSETTESMTLSPTTGSPVRESPNTSFSSAPSVPERKVQKAEEFNEPRQLENSAVGGPSQSLNGCAQCRVGQCNGKHKALEAKASPGPSVPQPGVAGVPLVPPGLGLEARIRNGVVLPEAPPRREPPETITIKVLDGTKVTFGPGLGVKQLMTGFESQQIIIENVPHMVKPFEVTEALSVFGEVVSVHFPENVQKKKGATMLIRASFSQPEAASQAVTALDGARLFGRTVSVRLSTFKSTSVGKGQLSDGDVLLEFPAPFRTGYVGYDTKEQALEAIRLANGTDLRGSWITATMHESIPRVSMFTVRFQGVPPDMQLKDFARYGENDGAMMDAPNYLSLRSALDGLRSLLETYGEMVSFNVLPPPYRKTVRVWATFALPSVAEEVCQALHNRGQRRFGDYRLCNNKLYARHIQSVTYTIPADVYDAMADDIHLLRMFVYDNGQGDSISVVNKQLSRGSRVVKIKLQSEEMQSLTRIKTAFERLLRGEQLVKNGEILWHGFFGRAAGITYLQDLQRSFPGVLINRDSRRRTLALFGPGPKRAAVRETLLDKIASLRAKKTYVFRIEQEIISLFMSTDMLRLEQELGTDMVSIDVWRRDLYVTGNSEVHGMALHALERTRQRMSTGQRPEVQCPVCFDEVTAPVTLKCGHTYCRTCLANYLLSAVDTKVFPLKCLARSEAQCTHSIPLSAVQEVLSPNDFNSVVHAAFFAYVHARPKEFHYCPTPDCPQVYRHAAPDTVLQCPSCFVRICPHCHSEAHDTENCPDRDTEDTRLFESWKNEHDVKSCPGCKAPIEREMGCNHMTCVRCMTHICWVCLAQYTRSEDVYDHMHAVHGGIGL